MGRWADFCSALFLPLPEEEGTSPEDANSGSKGGPDGLGSATRCSGATSSGAAASGAGSSSGSGASGSARGSRGSSTSEGSRRAAAAVGPRSGGEGSASSWAVGWLLVSGLGLLLRFATGLASYSGAHLCALSPGQRQE